MTFIFVSPLLYWHYNRSIVSEIRVRNGSQESEEEVLAKAKERVTFGNLYTLSERVEKLEEKYRFQEDRLRALREENQRLKGE